METQKQNRSRELDWRGWHIPNTLAGTSRPGYADTWVGDKTVDAWIREAKNRGFKSIVCLLDKDQLDHYADLKAGGLVEAYKAAGFHVYHYAVPDSMFPSVPQQVLQQIENTFPQMPKPVLVHCSAGIDRTGTVLEWLTQKVNT